MKAKWVNIVDSLQGNVDQRHYARRIPGNGKSDISNRGDKPTCREIDISIYRRGAEILIDRDNEKSNREPRYRQIEISIYRKGEKIEKANNK